MLTRDEAIPKLRNVVVALITRTIRRIETEVQLDASDGMPREYTVSLDICARTEMCSGKAGAPLT